LAECQLPKRSVTLRSVRDGRLSSQRELAKKSPAGDAIVEDVTKTHSGSNWGRERSLPVYERGRLDLGERIRVCRGRRCAARTRPPVVSSHWRDPCHGLVGTMAIDDYLAELATLETRLESESRPLISRALQEIVLDCLCPHASSVLSPNEYQLLMEAISEPVNEGTQVAMETLLVGLSRMVDSAPPALVAKLEVFAGTQAAQE